MSTTADLEQAVGRLCALLTSPAVTSGAGAFTLAAAVAGLNAATDAVAAQLGVTPPAADATPSAPAKPAAPVITAVVNADRTVDLDWSDVAGATYKLYERAQSPGGLGVITTSASKRGPLLAGRYVYYVTSVVNGVESAPSNDVPVTIADPVAGTTDSPVPTAPGTLPAGTSMGKVSWAAKPFTSDIRDSTAAGYASGVQRESSDMNIHTTPDPVPIVDTKWGRALKFVVPNRWVRIEVQPPNSVNSLSSGVVWCGGWTVFEEGFPLNPSAGWSVIFQLHGNDTTSPRFSLQQNHGELRLGDSKTICKVTTGRRYNWVLKCDLDAGKVSAWVDDVLCLDNFACGKSRTPYYAKTGWYHSASDPGGTVYQGPLRIGSGYGAVRAAA